MSALDDELGHQVELLRPDRAVAGDGDHPSRSATGSASAAKAPGRRGPAPLDGREQRRRLQRVGSESSAKARRAAAPRGASWPRPAPARAVLQDAALGDRDALDVGLLGARARARARWW